MHKAAWGGNLSLIRYFREKHGVMDTSQDRAGNFCADIAKMRGNAKCHQWLLQHCSEDRSLSYNVLGLDVGADFDKVRNRYLELARTHHPDKRSFMGIHDEKKNFIQIKAAYDHIKEGGRGKQSSPKNGEFKLLENHKQLGGSAGDDGGDGLFMARLIAVLSDYGDKGFPVSLLARRWNQIWPDKPFPTECIIERTVKCSKEGKVESMVIKKKAKLLKWLKWKCQGTCVFFRSTAKGDTLAFVGSNKQLLVNGSNTNREKV